MLLQHPADPVDKPLLTEQVRDGSEFLQILRFTAKTDEVRPHGRQYFYCSFCKAFRRGKRPRQRKFHDQIRSTAAGRFRPGIFAVDGRFSPLYKISAHDSNHGGIFSGYPPAFRQVIRMPVMERIVLGNNPDCFHVQPPKKTCAFLRNLLQ